MKTHFKYAALIASTTNICSFHFSLQVHQQIPFHNTVIYSANNTVLVHSVSVHTMCALNECTSTVFWYLVWWWFSEPKYVAVFLILITNICCVTNWINYCIIAKHNMMAPIKKKPFQTKCKPLLGLCVLLDYNIADCSVWVWNLVANIEGGT